MARALLILGLTTFAFSSSCRVLGLAARTSNPALAVALSPGDARVLAVRSIMLILDNNRHTLAQADDLARRALRRDTTAIGAVTTLSSTALLKGDEARALHLYDYAQSISRRDLVTQMYKIQSAVTHGDVASALLHYDIALRTNKTASDLLFPVLGDALVHPAIRDAAVPVIAARPVWAKSFLEMISVTDSTDPQAVLLLYTGLRRRGMAPPREAEDRVLTRLVGAGRPGMAWTYYAAARGRSDRSTVRNATFDPRRAGSAPFDWVLTSTDGITSSLDPLGRSGQLSFSVAPSTNGIIAGQMDMLPSGNYNLLIRTIAFNGSAGAVNWQLSCQDGRRLATVAISQAGAIATPFVVGPSCGQQWLRLIALPSDSPSGLTGAFASVTIGPAG